MEGGESLLKLEGCTVYYRKALALDRISMEVGGDELVSVIGANGAGKSTILKLIVGIVRPREGQVIFDGKSPTGCRLIKSYRRVSPCVRKGEGLLRR